MFWNVHKNVFMCMIWVKQLSKLALFKNTTSYLKKMAFSVGNRISNIVPKSLRNEKAELKLR